MKKKKRDKLGSIWVDTATLIIGDPCQLLQGDREGDVKVPTYDDLMKLIFPERPPETHARIDELFAKGDQMTAEEYKELSESMMIPSPNKVVCIPNRSGGVGAISFQTGCDGYYPVYVEYKANGEPARLVIELGGKVKP